MIKSIDQAFQILDTIQEGIPFEAIKFLYNHSGDKKIKSKLISSIEHAYDVSINDDLSSKSLFSPLWYAIVSENHLCEELINPVIKIFTTTTEDLDFLNEQGGYLVGALCERYQDVAPRKFLDAAYLQIENKTKNPYLYLFDALHYIDLKSEKEKLLEIARKVDFTWYDSFVGYLADIQFKDSIPVLKEILSKKQFNKFIAIELKEAIKRLENDISDLGKLNQPFVKWRGNWEEHYKAYEENFYFKEEEQFE